MTALDARLVPKILSLIDRFGKTVRVIEPGATRTNADYDPTTGKVDVGTPLSYDVKVTPPQPCREALTPGVEVMLGDMTVYVPAAVLKVPPTAQTTLEMDGHETWAVVAMGRIYTGDILALWELQLRR